MSADWQESSTWSYKPAAGPTLVERFKGKLFDSYLGRNSHPTQNHALKLFLRVNLKPMTGKTTSRDSNKTSFPIKEWSAEEWSRFTSQFERQARLWSNRFWLVPSKPFTLLDDKRAGRPVRPNIHCLLFAEVVNTVSLAHRTIEVANLDVDAIKRQGISSSPGSGTYRSNDKRYDSLDIKPRNTTYEDDKGVEHEIKNYYTIAHELGHAIGLPHIGVLKSRPQCAFAIALKSFGIKNVSSHLSGGSNAKVCYGRFDSAGLADNIMGVGTKFEAVNAQPWLERAAMHTNTVASDWKVALEQVGPRAVA